MIPTSGAPCEVAPCLAGVDRRLVGAVDGEGLELDRVALVESEVAGDRGRRRGRGELVRGPATRLQALDRVGDIPVVVAVALADQDPDRDGDRQDDEEEHGRRSGARSPPGPFGTTAAPSSRAGEVLDGGSALVPTSRAAADAVALLLVERRPALLALAYEVPPGPSVVVCFVVFGFTSCMGTSLEEGLRGKDLDLRSLGVPDQGQGQMGARIDAEVLQVCAPGRHVPAPLSRDRVDIQVVLGNSCVVGDLGLDARSSVVGRVANVELGDLTRCRHGLRVGGAHPGEGPARPPIRSLVT